MAPSTRYVEIRSPPLFLADPSTGVYCVCLCVCIVCILQFVWDVYGQQMEPLAARTPFMTVVGNHESVRAPAIMFALVRFVVIVVVSLSLFFLSFCNYRCRIIIVAPCDKYLRRGCSTTTSAIAALHNARRRPARQRRFWYSTMWAVSTSRS